MPNIGGDYNLAPVPPAPCAVAHPGRVAFAPPSISSPFPFVSVLASSVPLLGAGVIASYYMARRGSICMLVAVTLASAVTIVDTPSSAPGIISRAVIPPLAVLSHLAPTSVFATSPTLPSSPPLLYSPPWPFRSVPWALLPRDLRLPSLQSSLLPRPPRLVLWPIVFPTSLRRLPLPPSRQGSPRATLSIRQLPPPYSSVLSGLSLHHGPPLLPSALPLSPPPFIGPGGAPTCSLLCVPTIGEPLASVWPRCILPTTQVRVPLANLHRRCLGCVGFKDPFAVRHQPYDLLLPMCLLLFVAITFSWDHVAIRRRCVLITIPCCRSFSLSQWSHLFWIVRMAITCSPVVARSPSDVNCSPAPTVYRCLWLMYFPVDSNGDDHGSIALLLGLSATAYLTARLLRLIYVRDSAVFLGDVVRVIVCLVVSHHIAPPAITAVLCATAIVAVSTCFILLLALALATYTVAIVRSSSCAVHLLLASLFSRPITHFCTTIAYWRQLWQQCPATLADGPCVLHRSVAIEAASLAAWRASLRHTERTHETFLYRPPLLVRPCQLNTIGFASCAVAQLPVIAKPPSSLISPTAVVAEHDGIALHLSSRSATGYAGVTFRRSRRAKPYRAKAPGGKMLLGDFATALEAAVCYANHVSMYRSPASPVQSTAVLDSGEVIALYLTQRSSTGYCGVSRLPSRTACPFVARLGPSTADYIGCFPTALDAALAYALASRARDEFTESVELSFSCVDQVTADTVCGDLVATSHIFTDPLRTVGACTHCDSL